MKSFHVLFIDSYDSFCFNVQRLIEQQAVSLKCNIEVTTIRNDTFKSIQNLKNVLPCFDALVIGPGPGNPKNGYEDVGILNDIFKETDFKDIPILGICLGMQAMCMSENCDIEQLHTIKHGQVYEMAVTDEGLQSGLFANYPLKFNSTRYHSLHVIRNKQQGDSNDNHSVIPLVMTRDENGDLLMGVQIKSKPWFAVQYHPESCCSEYGDLLIQNFVKIASHWNQNITKRSLNKDQARTLHIETLKSLQCTVDRVPLIKKCDNNNNNDDLLNNIPKFVQRYNLPQIINDVNFTLKLVDQITQDKFIFASSSLSANRGEWSIIALPDPTSEVFTHYNTLSRTTIHKWQDPHLDYDTLVDGLKNNVSNTSLKVINEGKEDFWRTVSSYMSHRLATCGGILDNLPFIGGFVGILGYEMGSYISTTDSLETNSLRPDAKLVYINNCILINHVDGEVYLISKDEKLFPEEIINLFASEQHWIKKELEWSKELPESIKYDIVIPEPESYSKAFDLCQEYMHKGDSYEICLTTQTKVTPRITPLQEKLTPWRIFQTLVQKNPAPFTSFLQFNDLFEMYDSELCLISSSPERFLKWDSDTCELRPIKGTVKKSKMMDLEKATKILKTPKEFGENLMILDLIRNDLYELLPNVKVEEFMSVEEYKTVYQLVSVVRAFEMSKSNYNGMDILKHSLPPGSMTGAPKKITVELLQEKIEPMVNGKICGGNRGVYSGVTGYWSLNGRGDWSVNIRCLYSYDSGKQWNLGAGGAITVLSTLEGEREEMFTKLEAALQIFH